MFDPKAGKNLRVPSRWTITKVRPLGDTEDPDAGQVGAGQPRR